MINYQLSEQDIIDGRSDLSDDIIETSYTIINGKKVTVHDLLEDADTEDMANIIAMLLVDKDNAYGHAVDVLKQRFNIMFEDGEIEDHLVDEACEL